REPRLAEALELLGVGLAEVADHVRRERAVEVVAVRRAHHVHARQAVAVGLDHVELVAVEVEANEDRLEALQAARLPHLLVEPHPLLRVQGEVGCEAAENLLAVAAEGGRDVDVPARTVVDQAHAPSVEDHPPVGGNADLLDEVARALGRELLASLDLQVPDAAEQHEEAQADGHPVDENSPTEPVIHVAAARESHRARSEPSPEVIRSRRRRRDRNGTAQTAVSAATGTTEAQARGPGASHEGRFSVSRPRIPTWKAREKTKASVPGPIQP